MKRKGYIFEEICNLENLTAAAKEAAKGKKSSSYGVRLFLKNPEQKLLNLHNELLSGKFRTSEYRTMTILADRGKVREISKLPFYPDRIVHHAIMRVVKSTLTKSLIYDTYACIDGRGVSLAVKRAKRAMQDVANTPWCLKIDIEKFYPNICHEKLILDLKRKFKDEKFISLISEIIHSNKKGLPIGSYTSQLLANYALSLLDHYIKEVLKVKYYFRYCDDMVFLGVTKAQMWEIYHAVNDFITNELHLKIKPNYAIFPVGLEDEGEIRGRSIDFLGYRFTHSKTLLRKDMKKKFARRMASINNKNRRYEIMCSYKGWCMAGDCRNLWKTITGMKDFKELNIKAKNIGKDGKRFFDVEVKTLMDILNQEIIVKDFETGVNTRNGNDRYAVLIGLENKDCKFITNNYKMKDILDQCKESELFPFKAIVKRRSGNNNKADYYFE